jgi:imidazole glycerol-phosphate synthase subunit HisH
MSIAIVDYGMGNITSVKNTLKHIGFDVEVIDNVENLFGFSTIILPGVGAFGKAMERLKSTGLDEALKDAAESGKKIVGICLGMQLLFEESREFGIHNGLGLIKGDVLPFEGKIDLRVPHMGWNETKSAKPEFEEYNGDYYFVHSFYCNPKNEKNVLFKTTYGIEYCSGIVENNQIYGLQFHPEKSQKSGLELLKKILSHG